jgi:hypothetical protein
MCEGDDFNIFHKYVEEKLGRPIFTHEFAALADEIKERAKDDFIKLCADADNCEYCEENDTAEIEGIDIIYHYHNPNAYGYPEICRWKETYHANFCPVCNRHIDRIKLAGGNDDD